MRVRVGCLSYVILKVMLVKPRWLESELTKDETWLRVGKGEAGRDREIPLSSLELSSVGWSSLYSILRAKIDRKAFA